jgi:hypothetical protein
MQQQHDGRICRAGFTVEDVQATDFGRPVMRDGCCACARRALVENGSIHGNSPRAAVFKTLAVIWVIATSVVRSAFAS